MYTIYIAAETAKRKGAIPILYTRFLCKELFTQFLSQFVIISAVVTISQISKLVDKLTSFGVSFENLFLPFLYTLIPFFSIVIPLAFLFATLITFSRLSADGELTALIASGQSLSKLASPVVACALCVAILGTMSSLFLEPWAERSLQNFTYEKAQGQLDNFIQVNMKPGVFTDGFLGYVLYSEEMSRDKSVMKNIIIAPGRMQKDQNFTIYAPKGGLQGSVKKNDLVLNLSDGTIHTNQDTSSRLSILKFDHMKLDLLRLFKQRIFMNRRYNREYEAYYPGELRKHILESKKEWKAADANKASSKETIRTLASRYYKSSFLLQQRLATSFLAIGFGLLGMFLGIQDQRSAKSQAYLGVIVTITLSYALLSGCKWLGQKGVASPEISSWLPPLATLAVASLLIRRRNRLPLSEPLFLR